MRRTGLRRRTILSRGNLRRRSGTWPTITVSLACNACEDCKFTFDTVIPDLVRRHLDGSLRNRLRREMILAARLLFEGFVLQLVASGSRATCFSFRRHFRPHFGAAVC